MEKVLNRGLKFCITPLKLDITQVLVDFKKFERKMVWHEFWHDSEQDEDRKVKIFKTQKTNMPRDHKTPKGLKDCMAAIKSELMDPKNRHSVKSNITKEETDALKKLVQLQIERHIVIKPCDKGAGIAILNFYDYVKVCLEHLSGLTQSGDPYYEEVDAWLLLETNNSIFALIEEGYTNKILSKDEYEAMK